VTDNPHNRDKGMICPHCNLRCSKVAFLTGRCTNNGCGKPLTEPPQFNCRIGKTVPIESVR
jgi:hypothetical protein